MTWWQILSIVVGSVAVGFALIALCYRPIFKRVFDVLFSGLLLVLLSPLYFFLIVLVRIKLGSPVFFRQPRPGKAGKVFALHKFRTMTDARGEDGELLPDGERLTKFGSFLRASSLDELPEIWDIFRGKMSFVGPRPLLVEYLPLYNEEQAHRHDVKPGLTGLAQANGRNALTWERKFEYDVRYAKNVTFFGDLGIVFKTIFKVFKHDGITQEGSATMPLFTGTKTINILITSCGRRVELVKAFKAARDRLGIKGKIVCADCSDTAPALFFADVRKSVPRISDPKYIETLIGIVEEEKISLVIPTIDTELKLLADCRANFEELGAKVLVPDSEVVRICRDKFASVEFFKEHGFDAPRTLDESEFDSYDGDYPLFIRPRDGSSSVNAYKVNNMDELRFFTRYVKSPIVQQFVTGDEYTVDVLTDFDGKIILAVPRRRIATRSGEILKGRVENNAFIVDTVKRLVTELGVVGQVTVQGFLTAENKFVLIEINARFGGGATMSIKAGADYCEKIYRLLRGDKLDFDDGYVDGMLIVRFDDSLAVGCD